MPIVINEVVISVSVDNSSGTVGAVPANPPTDAAAKQQIIEECVEQVMEILAQQEEP